jgi:endonuclease/exonuclease/phosphatase family metal-dependent hydrolase
MRIISYNILDGGEGRADPIAEIILARRPDVVALVEADDPVSLDRIAKRLHMDYVRGKGGKKSAAILSRWPITATINHAGAYPEKVKSLLEGQIQEPGGKVWNVGVVHLHAHAAEADEKRREGEIDFVLKTYDKYRALNVPHILCGDFNSNSPDQIIDPSQCKPSTREEWKANGGDLPRRVVRKILDAGYLDTYAQHDPKRAATEGTFSTRFPGQRVDYIFSWGVSPDKIRSAWIERDRLAQYASDHFPIGAEIE